ncbi:MAG TPA: hypothetical protein VM240_06800 [Verrucomicrobiae bacterium]|nr:hypothetical protein [Verrucomicrobiae bacterium]
MGDMNDSDSAAPQDVPNAWLLLAGWIASTIAWCSAPEALQCYGDSLRYGDPRKYHAIPDAVMFLYIAGFVAVVLFALLYWRSAKPQRPDLHIFGTAGLALVSTVPVVLVEWFSSCGGWY